MSDDEKAWAAEVNRLVAEEMSCGFKSPPPVIDLAIAHELGFPAGTTAMAICGFNRPVLDAILAEMRKRGLLDD